MGLCKAFGLVLGGLLLAGVLGAAEPTRRLLPADGVITLRDYGYRDWPTALVEYALPVGAKYRQGPVRLVGEDGTPVPAQIDEGVLAFVTSLAKGATATYRLADGEPATSALRVATSAQAVEAGNEYFTLRLPPLGEQTFAEPRPAADVPGPLTAWQEAGGEWLGASRFVTARPVAALTTRVVRQGPACFTYEARYRFAPRGEYVCRVTVLPGVEYARIAEEYDFGERTAGEDFLVLELHRGFTPGSIGWQVGEKFAMQRQPFQAYIEKETQANANKPAPVGGQGETPMPPRPAPDCALLNKVLPAGKWGGAAGVIEIGGELPADAKAVPAGRVSVVPLHTGSWRRTLALTVWHQPGAGVVIALPISTRRATWYAEVTDDISPFSTHEHDRDLPVSYGRREWALCFGGAPEMLQSTAGFIGLDRYKDWVLDWPETSSAKDYPRSVTTAAQVARLKQHLEQHPDRAALAKFYLFSGQAEDAIRHARLAIPVLSEQRTTENWRVAGLSHYRQTQFLAPSVPLADDALACPELPAELRGELRRALAVTAYLISDPDVNPRGVGVHLGNNNMPINRTCILPMVAALLPDHPLYAYWMAQSTAFVQYKLATYFAPDGGANEPGTYQLYGPLRFLSDAVTAIRNSGGPDLAAPLLRNGEHLLNLTMPDARYEGRRILPGMGNSGNLLGSWFGWLLDDAARLDPALAGRFQAAYRDAWPDEPIAPRHHNHIGMAFRYRPDIPATPTPLVSTAYPTYGVTFRAHGGTPQETAMLFRIGTNWGHWDTDALNVIVYGQGAPLSPGTGYQYYYGPGTENNAIYHNQVKVGKYDLQEVFGRVDNELRDCGFGPNADYALGARYYPPEVFADGGSETWWQRHVLFLKSPQPTGPSYFVLRDTFASATARPTWWTWMNLEGADRIRVDGQPFNAADYPVNAKLPADKLVTRTGQTVELATDFGASTWMYFAEPRAIRPRITLEYGSQGRQGLKPKTFPLVPGKEVKTILEAVGQPGEDFHYVVFPRPADAAAPAVTRLAPGVLKVITAEATDYVFTSDEPLAFSQDGIEFSGRAGAVRVFADRVALCLNSGSGRVGYRGCVVSGLGPFERVIPLGELKAGEIALPGGDERVWQTVDLGEGLSVKAEAPFTARLDGDVIRIQTDGRARQVFVTKPAWTDWLDYRLDGQGWMACWTDYPASGWGTYRHTALAALTVPAGRHELELRHLVYPAVWTRSFTPTLTAATPPSPAR